jgi:superfamily I DNA/RNA helicase
MKTWLCRLSDLTPAQRQVVEMPPRENGFVIGYPGSGKTQVLIHRAAYLVQSHGISPPELKLFVFTDVMERLVKSAIIRLDLPTEMVTTFDHWCRFFYIEHISQDLPRIYLDGRVDYMKVRRGVLYALQRKEELQISLRFALVDDGQDLTPEAFGILSLAAQNITILSDPQLKLVQESASKSFVLNALELKKESSSLCRDHRSSPHVAQLASHFIEDEEFRHEYLSQVRNEQSPSESPLCYIASSEKKELDHLSELVRQRQSMKEKVGILVPTDSLVHRLTKALRDRGIETEKAIALDAQNVIHTPYDLSNDLPKITTYHMARGLTFDSVLMPQLTENAFAKIPSSLRYRLLFCGITRASRWVYLSTIKGQEFVGIGLLKLAEKEEHLKLFDKLTPQSKNW